MTERQAKVIVRLRSNGVCELCDSARALDWHHRLNRSQGGQWDPVNGLDACRPCHRALTDDPDARAVAIARGWVVLRGGGEPADVPAYLPRFAAPMLLESDGGLRFAA